MAFSYGFYNSLNGDRKYDSEDLSRMFDGIIYDGVIGAVGDTFAVKAGTGNTVNVSSGRAWFNHTWTYNDAPMPISCGSAAVLLDRYDAIVLEVNAASDVRKNSIKVVTGTEASIPAKPTMENTEFVHQYPLAYILRKAGSSSISQSQIENTVGTSECPLASGVMASMSFDQIMAQWKANYTEWMGQQQEEQEEYIANRDSEFNAWFTDLQNTLDSNTAANLNNKINKLGTISINLKAANWTGTGPYRQRVSISTMTSDRNFGPMYVAPTGNQETDAANLEALGCLSRGVTGAGYVDIYCYEQKPEIDFTVLADGRI